VKETVQDEDDNKIETDVDADDDDNHDDEDTSGQLSNIRLKTWSAMQPPARRKIQFLKMIWFHILLMQTSSRKETLLATLAEDLIAAPALEAYVVRGFSVCGERTTGK